MKNIDITLFLADESDIGVGIESVSLDGLDAIESLSKLDIVVAKISSTKYLSEQDIQLIYGLSRQNNPDLAVLVMDLNDVTIGLIWPDELHAFMIEYEKPENNAKDLGSASSSSWASYTKPVIFRCAGNDEHPRFACIQRGAEIPSKCPICKSPMKEIKK